MSYNADRYKSDPEYKARIDANHRKYYNKVKDTPEFKERRRASQRTAYQKRLQSMSEEQLAAYREYQREHSRKHYQKIKRYRTDPDYAASLTPAERERIQRAIVKYRESSKKYYADHKSECYAMQREWVAKNTERRRELTRQYYRKCKERKALIGVM